MDVHMKKQKMFILGFLLALSALAANCAGGAHHSLAPDYKSRLPRSIAILPVLNETVNLKAAEVFQPILHKKLSQKGYETPGVSFIDRRLLEKEIREAGQINTLSLQDLGKLLGTDALLYTTITEFSTTYLLAYASMTVGARFELKDAKTGEKLWESDHQVKERRVGKDHKSMEDALKFAAFQSYAPYVEKVINASFVSLPNGPLASAPAPASCLMPGGKR